MTERTALLSIPVPTLSQNRIQRLHWAQYRDHKKDLHLLIRSAISRLGRNNLPAGCNNGKLTTHNGKVPKGEVEGEWTPPSVKVNLLLIRYGPQTLDKGNLIGGAKPLLDVLTEEGILVDDRPEWLEDKYEQVKEKGVGKTILKFTWGEKEKQHKQQEKRNMFEFEKKSVEIDRIEVREKYNSEDGQTFYICRAKLVIEDIWTGSVPEMEGALEAAKKAGEDIEGTVAVTFKSNAWPTQVLKFSDSKNKRYSAKLIGAPVNRPKASIVGDTGIVTLAWTVEDRRVEEKMLSRLCKAVKSKTILFSTDDVQGSLPLQEVA